MLEHFHDSSGGGGFFFTADDHEKLIARTKSFQDSSVPSGNAMAAMALLRLGRLTGNSDWIEKAEQTIAAGIPLMARSPLASGQMLTAMDSMLEESKELVFVVTSQEELGEAAKIFRDCRLPGSTNWTYLIINISEDQANDYLAEIIAGKTAIDGEPTLYVCSGEACQAPIVGLENANATLVAASQTK